MGKAETKFANTANRMDDALVSLLDVKPFEDITITDVCKEAGVHRSTFYAHYGNMLDLLEEVKNHTMSDFFSRFEGISDESGFLTREHLSAYLGFVEENEYLFSVFMKNINIFDGWDIFSEFEQSFAEGMFPDSAENSSETRYRLLYLTTGVTAIVSAWVASGLKESREHMVDLILDCTR